MIRSPALPINTTAGRFDSSPVSAIYLLFFRIHDLSGFVRLLEWAGRQDREDNVLYAIIKTGGKQYRVSPGEILEVERLPGQVGEEVAFEEVLLAEFEGDLQVGNPNLNGTRVVGTIVEHGKGDKVTVFKFKRRKGYRRKAGHRQLFTGVKIESIETPSGKKIAAEAEQAADDKKESPAPHPEVAARVSEAVEPADQKVKAEKPKATAADKSAGKPTRKTQKKSTAPKKPAATRKSAAKSKQSDGGKTAGKDVAAKPKKGEKEE